MFSNRKNRGSNNGGSELTEDQVRAIRRAVMPPPVGRLATHGELARLYKVSSNTIGRIVRGETWNWLDMGPGEEHLAPDSPAMQKAAEESLRRLQALGAASDSTGQGLKRLEEETAPLQTAEDQLRKLTGEKP
jgi:hypothetical protein